VAVHCAGEQKDGDCGGRAVIVARQGEVNPTSKG
jgi:hypothetical protein